MTTKQKAVSRASVDPDGLASLNKQYGCGPVHFLLFDNVVQPTADWLGLLEAEPDAGLPDNDRRLEKCCRSLSYHAVQSVFTNQESYLCKRIDDNSSRPAWRVA
jgi:hypothetical protein